MEYSHRNEIRDIPLISVKVRSVITVGNSNQRYLPHRASRG
jgi:hypothetical protein